MLAGDCDSHPAHSKHLDGSVGLFSTFNMAENSNDQAMTFIKNDHWLAVFQGMNEATDTMQLVGGFNVASMKPVDMCRFKVHAGVAAEFGSFQPHPNLVNLCFS